MDDVQQMMMGKVFEFTSQIAKIQTQIEATDMALKRLTEANEEIKKALNAVNVELVKQTKGTIVNVNSDTNIDNIGRDANISQS